MAEISLETYLKAGQTILPNLLLQHYHQLKIDNEELVLIIQIFSFQGQGDDFPDSKILAERMGTTSAHIFEIINHLVEKKLLKIETTIENGQASDQYQLDGIYEGLTRLMTKEEALKHEKQVENKRAQVFQRIEVEFGHPLSSFEMEMIHDWLEVDHYQPEVIILALREAVLNKVYNLKYVDRILIAWERKNLTTPDEVKKEQDSFQGRMDKRHEKSDEELANQPDIPLFDWTNPPKD